MNGFTSTAPPDIEPQSQKCVHHAQNQDADRDRPADGRRASRALEPAIRPAARRTAAARTNTAVQQRPPETPAPVRPASAVTQPRPVAEARAAANSSGVGGRSSSQLLSRYAGRSRQARCVIIQRAPRRIFLSSAPSSHAALTICAMKSLTGMAGERRAIGEHPLDGLGLLRAEVRRDARLEFLDQHRHALGTALAVTDGIVDLDARARGPVLEEHLHRIADVALVGRVVFLGESRRSRALRVLARSASTRGSRATSSS